ncbi:MAG: VanZ family protein [Syntrophales bacterium]
MKREVKKETGSRLTKKSSFRHGLVYGAPVLVYAGLIFILSALSRFPEEISFIVSFDKWAHFIEYYFFGFLIRRWLVNKRSNILRNNSLFFTMVTGICYGLSDEWHQSYVPGRNSSSEDLLFDALGILAAAVTYPAVVTMISFVKKIDEILERKFIHD